jgi:hypothetical protein
MADGSFDTAPGGGGAQFDAQILISLADCQRREDRHLAALARIEAERRSLLSAAAASSVEIARPIATAPIGGPDHFPPETPGAEPLRCVLVWQPAAKDRPGGWCLGYWGGSEESAWYDDMMSLLEP